MSDVHDVGIEPPVLVDKQYDGPPVRGLGGGDHERADAVRSRCDTIFAMS
jgi:hypothetical protein